jgi:hypothetical protein
MVVKQFDHRLHCFSPLGYVAPIGLGNAMQFSDHTGHLLQVLLDLEVLDAE